MRLGLFGGTFDPIHFGHLRSALEVAEAFALDEVRFIPCGVPLHRSSPPGAAAHHRLEMVRLAVADTPGLSVSDVEVVRRGASYSIDTVREFLAGAAPNDDLYLILGLDAFSLVGSWKDWRELLALTHVIVTSRPGFGDKLCYEELPVVVREAFCYDPVRSGFRNNLGKKILFKRLTDVFISASEIRELLRKGKSIHDLTPVQVQSYVEDQHLYSELLEP